MSHPTEAGKGLKLLDDGVVYEEGLALSSYEFSDDDSEAEDLGQSSSTATTTAAAATATTTTAMPSSSSSGRKRARSDVDEHVSESKSSSSSEKRKSSTVFKKPGQAPKPKVLTAKERMEKYKELRSQAKNAKHAGDKVRKTDPAAAVELFIDAGVSFLEAVLYSEGQSDQLKNIAAFLQNTLGIARKHGLILACAVLARCSAFVYAKVFEIHRKQLYKIYDQDLRSFVLSEPPVVSSSSSMKFDHPEAHFDVDAVKFYVRYTSYWIRALELWDFGRKYEEKMKPLQLRTLNNWSELTLSEVSN